MTFDDASSRVKMQGLLMLVNDQTKHSMTISLISQLFFFWMAAGSKLPRSSHGFFSPSSNFSNTLYVAKVFEQAVGPGVLQTTHKKILYQQEKNSTAVDL